MKLKATQWIGAAAIIVFGGGIILRMTQPSEREVMEKRLASLPTISAPPVEIPMPDLSAIQPVPPLDLSAPAASSASTGASGSLSYPGEPDYLNLGSQAAKDDMYCAGVISAEFDARPGQHPDEMSKQLAAQIALDDAGTAKLVAEGASTQDESAGFTLAYAAKAKADRSAGTLRIPFATCMTRAAALPKAH